MFKLKDNIFFGLIPGILVPVIIALFLYDYWGLGDFKDFYANSAHSGNLTKLLSLGCLLNLGLFYLFLRFDKYMAARGVIAATLLYVFVTVYYMMK